MKVQSLALLPWLCGLVVSQKTMDYTPWAPVDPRDPTPPVVSPLECQKALHETVKKRFRRLPDPSRLKNVFLGLGTRRIECDDDGRLKGTTAVSVELYPLSNVEAGAMAVGKPASKAPADRHTIGWMTWKREENDALAFGGPSLYFQGVATWALGPDDVDQTSWRSTDDTTAIFMLAAPQQCGREKISYSRLEALFYVYDLSKPKGSRRPDDSSNALTSNGICSSVPPTKQSKTPGVRKGRNRLEE